jgi:hypothetical protein
MLNSGGREALRAALRFETTSSGLTRRRSAIDDNYSRDLCSRQRCILHHPALVVVWIYPRDRRNRIPVVETALVPVAETAPQGPFPQWRIPTLQAQWRKAHYLYRSRGGDGGGQSIRRSPAPRSC